MDGLRPWHRWPLLLGVWAIPVSIAASELCLSIAAAILCFRAVRRESQIRYPRCLPWWLLWAGLEVAVWISSGRPAEGWGEIRHLLLIGVLVPVLSGFEDSREVLLAWKGVFVTATLSSLFLIGGFVRRLYLFQKEIAAGGDTGYYLRTGGLLHHWMIYGTVEIVVVAGFIAYWWSYPARRLRVLPLALVNAVAIVLSLTRMTWVTCSILLIIHLIRKRSPWIAALPAAAVLLFMVSPEAVRTRAARFTDLTYYSNAERLQMINVGWRMIAAHPLGGVGPGRVETAYRSYLRPEDPVPAYHGHLHNNVLQIAAQFGIPVALSALLFTVVLFWNLVVARRTAADLADQFLSEAALLALLGFTISGLFEYTYGHALGLIMIAFAILPTLVPKPR